VISHKHKCIFLHIPRTGGTAIETSICGEDYWFINKREKHLIADQAKEKYSDYWNNYFKFTIVRNPYDRIYSLVKRYPKYANQALNGKILENVDGYLQKFAYCDKPIEFDHRWCDTSKLIDENLSEHSMYENIFGRDMDLILDYDNLIETISIFTKAIGIETELVIQKGNNYEQFISDRAKDQIYNIHKNDIDRFKFNNRNFRSQLGQDKWVLAQTLYKKGGFFVEAGACDGKRLSNTFCLEKDYGWSGICCEPNPNYHADLHKNRTSKISHDCLYGISNAQVQFAPANELGGIISDFKNDGGEKRKNKRNMHGQITANTISLMDLLKKYNAPKNIDYISLDTEGSEIGILSTFDFKEYNVKLWTVEHNNISFEKLVFMFESNGYNFIKNKFDAWFFKK
jgi:FkbM family methyltransferase